MDLPNPSLYYVFQNFHLNFVIRFERTQAKIINYYKFYLIVFSYFVHIQMHLYKFVFTFLVQIDLFHFYLYITEDMIPPINIFITF